MRRQTIDAGALVFVFHVYSLVIPSHNLSIVELRERNHCFPTNSSKMSDSYLWRVVRDPPVYFFGTIHVPYPRVWDFIPENTKQAFRESENAFFELDLTDSRTMQNLRQCQMLPRGENLSSVLPESMYRRLKDHLGYVERMMPSWGVYDDRFDSNWERKKPIWVMIWVNTLNEADIKSRAFPVLDVYLTLEAKRMNKSVGAVEEVEEQCDPLNGLNASQIPTILNSTMTPAELLIAEEIDRYFVQELINKRNRHMAARIKEIIEANRKKSFFFAFGAGHFLGNNSVLDLLRAEGFEIENIPADVDLDSLKGSSEDTSDSVESNTRPNRPWWRPQRTQLEEDKNNFNELWVQIKEDEQLESVSDKLVEDLQQHVTTAEPGNIGHVCEPSMALLLLTGICWAAMKIS